MNKTIKIKEYMCIYIKEYIWGLGAVLGIQLDAI